MQAVVTNCRQSIPRRSAIYFGQGWIKAIKSGIISASLMVHSTKLARLFEQYDPIDGSGFGA
jgi:hypothetical protein